MGSHGITGAGLTGQCHTGHPARDEKIARAGRRGASGVGPRALGLAVFVGWRRPALRAHDCAGTYSAKVVTTESEQHEPNAFENAILRALARETPSLDVDHLRVRGRKFTGVGSYTDFVCDESGERRSVSLKARISVPGVPNGMGAVLYFHGDRPACLETFTYRDDFWTGAFEGFSVG